MLTIEIKINGSIIDFIHIHNQGFTIEASMGETSVDECNYGYARNGTETDDCPVKIRHCRSDGWEPLVIKVLRDILKRKAKE